MKNLLFTRLLFCFFLAGLMTLLPTLGRAQAFGYKGGWGSSTGTDRISGLALDAAGNLYATGSYSGTFDFGVGMLPWTGNLDGFVAKFSPAGVCQWAIRFNGPGTAQDQGLGIATNGTSVYVGGVFQTSISVNGAAAITGYGGIDGFGLKLDAATGATQWVSIFGSGSTDAVQAMCIDNSGNMYATGYFSSNSTYPTATFGSFTRSTNGVTGTDSYVAKLDNATGNVVWVSTGGMSGYNDNVSNSGIAFSPEQNAVVMVGSTQSPGTGYTATFNNQSPTPSLTLPSQGGLDVIVLKLDATTGTYLNANIVGGPSNSNEEALCATYDPVTKNIFLAGYYNTGALTFGSQPAIPLYGSDDFFYVSYDPAANNFVWAKGAGSTIQDRAQSMCSNGVGSIILTGRYRTTLNAPTASSPLTVVSSRTSSADEIFMLKVNATTGVAEQLLTPVGDNTINTGDIGTGSAANSTKTWIGGMFGGTITIPGLGSMTTSGGTTADMLLFRYDAPAPLPVRLQSFNAVPVSNDVQLAWRTQSEVNNDHFEVERSTDGRSYTSIGQRPAVGASLYSYNDAGAVALGTTLYYRLKIVSRTGEIGYSPVVTVNLGRRTETFGAATPNPFAAELHIGVNLPAAADVRITLSDLGGRKIASRSLRVGQGSSSLAIPEADQLMKGAYLLTVECGSNKTTQKIIKQ